MTVYAAPSDFPSFIEGLSLELEHGDCADRIRSAVKVDAVMNAVRRYQTGVAIYWSEVDDKYMVLPPFPIPRSQVSVGRPDISVLNQVLERKHVIGVVLVAWGSYALGVFDGESLVVWKTGTGLIHKQHRKGGRSEKRFARRTEEQKEDFLRRVANRIEEKFGNFQLEYIFFGGNRLILKPLIRECHYLQTQAYKLSPRVLEVRHADRQALSDSLNQITRSLVFTF